MKRRTKKKHRSRFARRSDTASNRRRDSHRWAAIRAAERVTEARSAEFTVAPTPKNLSGALAARIGTYEAHGWISGSFAARMVDRQTIRIEEEA